MNDMKVESDERIINALADRILGEDAGLDLDDIDALADLLTANAYKRLLIALDLCTIHRCDIEICIDDNRPCQEIEKEWS